MVEDKNDKNDKKQKNKGVNANPSKVYKRNVYFSDTESLSLSLSPIKSIARVKNELQTVIDLMGPSTPQFLQSSSNDGDNELSISSEVPEKLTDESKQEEPPSETEQSHQTTDKTEPPDVTFPEDTDVSIVAGKNSTSLDMPEYPYPEHPYPEHPQMMCPPPMLPANMVFNSECMCPQMATYMHNGVSAMPFMGGVAKEGKKIGRHKNFLYNIFKNLTAKTREYTPDKYDYYAPNIKDPRNDSNPPRRLVFDLVGDVPRHCYRLVEDFEDPKFTHFPQSYPTAKVRVDDDIKNEQFMKNPHPEEKLPERKESVRTLDRGSRRSSQANINDNSATRVDVYYFDRGDSNFLKTTDSPPVVATENLAEKTEAYTTRFWAEVFGTLHIGVSFGISFVLQLIRFLLYSLFRPLTIGLVQLGTDYFFKPCIATFFNAIIQPPLIFLLNVCTSLKDVSRPIAEGMGFFLREFAAVIRAFRIVDLKREKIIDVEDKNQIKEKVEENAELVS